MNKGKRGRKLGRKRDLRRALLRDLATALVQYEHITTTEAKAKELRPFMERWVTKARKAGGERDVAVRREIARYFGPATVKKLVEEIAPRFKNRPGGYTRIIKRAPRRGDAARRAIIEFVGASATKTSEPVKTQNEKANNSDNQK